MVKILELGAGTGATSTKVLGAMNKMSPESHYVFSDLSTAFLRNAQERFAQYPFVEYIIFDAEKPAVEQGIASHQFDIIFGTNVVHATSHLPSTLCNVHRLLKPGGSFILNEISESNMNEDMTWGMTEGWWLFTDCEMRTEYPLLQKHQWQKLFNRAGFSVTYHETCPDLAQSIIVGESGQDVVNPEGARFNANN